jgi:hypothetical protein
VAYVRASSLLEQRSSRDAYTLLMDTKNNATNATLYDKLSFNFVTDISPSF